MSIINLNDAVAVVGCALALTALRILRLIYKSAVERHGQNVATLNELMKPSGVRATPSGRFKDVGI